MKPVGLLFRPKARFDVIEKELIPSFDQVLEEWINGTKRTSFADPDYVFEITYVTNSLRNFIKRIADRLSIAGITGGPLERGLGFGKTHALIFLWHLFTSDLYNKVKKVNINISDETVRETLVLGMDFSRGKPLVRIVDELKAYADLSHPIASIKDTKLLRAVGEVVKRYESELYTLSSEKLAEVISEIMERYRNMEGRPRLLLLIDELGWGLAQKLRSYADRVREGSRSDAELIYGEANTVVNFLSYLYAKLHSKPIYGVVIWVLADQDRKEIEALARKHQDVEAVYSKISGMLSDLDIVAERYSRGLGGTSLAELSYSPEHALEIARYRLLKEVEGNLASLQNEYANWLESIARQLNLLDAFTRYKDELRRFYPFSLGLINLLKKLMNPRDAPATEYVRTAIFIAVKAAQSALDQDPEGAYAIGVKHLSIPEVVQSKLMKEFELDWADAAGDIELVLSNMGKSNVEASIRKGAEMAAKYIFAKGVTANIMESLESRERWVIEKYGSTIDEIQLEVISSLASDYLGVAEKVGVALEMLRSESARIDEREVEGKRYYLPSLFRTVYNKLASYIAEEKGKLDNKAFIPLYIRQSTIPSLFINARLAIEGRSSGVVISLMEYKKVGDVDAMLSDVTFQEAQSRGQLLLVLVPLWDIDLFNELHIYGKSYDDIVRAIVDKMQDRVKRGTIRRHLHVVILLPDLSTHSINKVLEKLALYEGTRRFLDYLSKKEDIVNERLREYEETLIKRRDLISILNDEIKKRHLRELQSRLEREIGEAKRFAQNQLVKLSRDIVTNVLELYKKAIYYSIDKEAFTAKDIASSEAGKTLEGRGEALILSDLTNYASIVNKFLADIVRGLAYDHDPVKVARALLTSYQKEFERGVSRERDKISEVLENIMLGTYGVKPLSIDIARDAVKSLNGQRIELEGRTIIISVDESSGFIGFKVETREPTVKVEESFSAESTRASIAPVEVTTLAPLQIMEQERAAQYVSLELPPRFDVDDISKRLTFLINLLRDLGAEISYIDLKLEGASISLNARLSRPSIESLSDVNVRAIMNMLSRISDSERRSVSMDIRFSKDVPESSVRKVFGEYLGSRRTSLDRFLP